MACRAPDSSIDLAAASHMSLKDARGTRIRVVRGTVWITQERSYDDIILCAGEAWTVEKNGRTIIQAHDDTRLCLPRAPHRWWHARRHALARQRDAALDFLHGMARGWLSLCPRRALPYY
jgi:hypothetical protein